MSNDMQIPELDARGLRSFALTTAFMFVLIFGLCLPWLFGFDFPAWPWVLAGTLVFFGLLSPAKLGLVYRAWMQLAILLNRIVSPIAMSILFCILIVPPALFMRVIGRDTMLRKFDKQSTSYRIASEPTPAKKMERPF